MNEAPNDNLDDFMGLNVGAAATPNRATFPDSTNVASMTYDPDNLVLLIEFRNGGVYRYPGVRPDVWRDALAAESIGKFIGARIRGKYESSKVLPVATPAPDA